MFGLHFAKKDSTEESWKKLTRVLDIINIDLSKLKKDMEMLQVKFRSKVFREAPEDVETEKSKIDDGFDELRGI